MDARPSKHEYYLELAKTTALRSTCLRRKYGAVIVKNDTTVSSGYNGSPRGCTNCSENGTCAREEANIPAGERYELCKSVTAAQNAMLSASAEEMAGATMYLAGTETGTGETVYRAEPSLICQKMMINSGIKTLIVRNCESGEFAVGEIRVSSFIKNIEDI